MRLPAINELQQQGEAARALHEQLWTAHKARLRGTCDGRVFVPARKPDELGQELVKLSSNLHRFWGARGFVLHCRQARDKTGIWCWVDPRAGQEPVG